jgi:hypothetical protein
MPSIPYKDFGINLNAIRKMIKQHLRNGTGKMLEYKTMVKILQG